MAIKAIGLSCTLKKSPKESNTEALMSKLMGFWGDEVDWTIERVVDYDLPAGMGFELGEGDRWPELWKKVAPCQILLIGTPIWMGHKSSVCQRLMERLDGTYDKSEQDDGRYHLYNKVAGCVVTGSEDGAHSCAESVLFNLTHFGALVAPNCDSYWVGKAGPGPSYMEAGGDKHPYTDKTARIASTNLLACAKMLQQNPISTDIDALTKESEAYTGK